MSFPYPPLGFTPLVYRVLDFAQQHYQILGISYTTLCSLIETLDAETVPTYCSRTVDTMDRYDIAGLYLYVRTDSVILLAGSKILCASIPQQRIYIQPTHPVTNLIDQRQDVLIQEAL